MRSGLELGDPASQSPKCLRWGKIRQIHHTCRCFSSDTVACTAASKTFTFLSTLLLPSGTMLSTLWHSATSSSSARQDVANSEFSSNSVPRQLPNTQNSAQAGTPFTDFVLSRLPNEDSQKLFALSFGEHLRHDPDAREIDFDDVYKWLGIPLKANALRLL